MKKLIAVGLLVVGSLVAQNTQETQRTEKDFRRQVACMTEVIYYEAGNQSRAGKLAVAFVVFNRARRKDTTDYCSIIYEKDRAGRCQFAWCNSKPKIKWASLWDASKLVAEEFITDPSKFVDNTKGAEAFRRPQDSNMWFRNMRQTAIIGGHIFYALPNSKKSH